MPSFRCAIPPAPNPPECSALNPFFLVVLYRNFDGNGEFGVGLNVGPGLQGLDAGFQVFSLDGQMKWEASNVARVLYP